MKAVIFYILSLCFCLAGAHNSAHATAYKGGLSFSATHNTVHKQQVAADNFIDVEDENDDKDITRKFTSGGKWLSVIRSVFISVHPNTGSSAHLTHHRIFVHAGSEICIEQRVLRI